MICTTTYLQNFILVKHRIATGLCAEIFDYVLNLLSSERRMIIACAAGNRWSSTMLSIWIRVSSRIGFSANDFQIGKPQVSASATREHNRFLTVDGDLQPFIACPRCDALYRARLPSIGERAVCARCHTTLIAPRRKAGLKIIALNLAMFVLVLAALFLPFLEISVRGVGNRASLLDTALAFRSGSTAFLAVATIAMIVVIPLTRMILILYVLVPMAVRQRPARHARAAFRFSQQLKPWAMAEIFAIGCAVALVKVSGLAQIGFGPAFWMFAVLVVISVINDRYLCTWSVWEALERKR